MPKEIKVCMVNNCLSGLGVVEPGIYFHRIPAKRIRKVKWMQALRKKKIAHSNSPYVCSKHFEPTCFQKNKSRLRPNAIPTLFDSLQPIQIIQQPKPISLPQAPYISPLMTTNQLSPINFSNFVIINPATIINQAYQETVVPTINSFAPITKASKPPTTSNVSLVKTNENETLKKKKTKVLPRKKSKAKLKNKKEINIEIIDISNESSDADIINDINLNNENVSNGKENNFRTEINNGNTAEDPQSIISLNSSDSGNDTQSQTNETQYVLVELNDNDSNQENLNSSNSSKDGATIIATGSNVFDLINDAKLAMKNNLEKERIKQYTRIPTKRRVWRANKVGDCQLEDMDDPDVRKHNWEVAMKEIKTLRQRNRKLLTRTRRLEIKLETANKLVAEFNENRQINDGNINEIVLEFENEQINDGSNEVSLNCD